MPVPAPPPTVNIELHTLDSLSAKDLLKSSLFAPSPPPAQSERYGITDCSERPSGERWRIPHSIKKQPLQCRLYYSFPSRILCSNLYDAHVVSMLVSPKTNLVALQETDAVISLRL